jgi:glycyl-tRNA synthetase
MADGVYEKIFDLAKRRGFVYPAFELYGGAAGFYDYGPLGAQLKALVEARFRELYVVGEGAAEINTPAITVEPVLKASGHVDHFSDVVLSCRKCGAGYRADHFLPEQLERMREKVKKSGLPAPAKDGIVVLLEALVRRIKEHPSVAEAERIRTKTIEQADAAQVPGGGVKEGRNEEGGWVRGKNLDERLVCPTCGNATFEPAANFNLMFKTFIGPGTGKVGFMRPETAQAMFVDFPLLYRYFREQLPFAAVQVGRAYRNEISPRQGLIRLREFNQMEVEAFFDPTKMSEKGFPKFRKVKGTVLNIVPNTTQELVSMTIGEAVRKRIVANAALGYHLVLVHRLLTGVGLDPARLRFRQHLKDEMAHYANDCWDAEYLSQRFGWVECVGVADRGSFDLTQHGNASGKPLVATRRYDAPVTRERTRIVPVAAKLGPLFKKDAPKILDALSRLDDRQAQAARAAADLEVGVDGVTHRVPREAYEVQTETETVHGEPFVPHVVEPSFGVDRILYGILEHNHRETVKEGEPYTLLTLPPAMAPITVGVFPLMPKDGLDTLALKVEAKLKAEGLRAYYDDSGAIGRRYARADEVGTPLAVTIDYDSLKDRSVTLRDRDTTAQLRVPIGRLPREIRRRLEAPRAVVEPPTPRAEPA